MIQDAYDVLSSWTWSKVMVTGYIQWILFPSRNRSLPKLLNDLDGQVVVNIIKEKCFKKKIINLFIYYHTKVPCITADAIMTLEINF